MDAPTSYPFEMVRVSLAITLLSSVRVPSLDDVIRGMVDRS